MGTGGRAEDHVRNDVRQATGDPADRTTVAGGADGDLDIGDEIADRQRIQALAERIRQEATRAFHRDE